MNVLRKGFLSLLIATLAVCLGIFAFSSVKTDSAFAAGEDFLSGVYVIDDPNDYKINSSGRIEGVNNSVLERAEYSACREVQLVIPAKVGSSDVTGIASSAFYHTVGDANIRGFENKISYVYLPDIALTSDSTTNTVFRNAVTIITTSARYSALCDQFPKHAGKITYPVDVNFDLGYETDGAVTYKKLAGQSFSSIYDEASGKWRTVSGTTLPVQQGYLSTAWYSDDKCTVPANYGSIEADLAKKPYASELNYYSVYRPQSGYDLPETIKLEADGSRYGVDRALEGVALSDDLTASFAGGASYVVAEGNHTINVELKSEYGIWRQPIEITVKLARTRITLGEAVSWSAKTDTSEFSLISGKVYEYAKRGEEENTGAFRYSLSELTDDDTQRDYVARTPHYEEEAIARNRGTAITIFITPRINPAAFEIEYDNLEIDGEIFTAGTYCATDTGKHSAYASIAVKEGYDYTFVNYDTTATGVVVSKDGKKAIVQKEWYIVETGNPLVVNDSVENPEQWTVDGWVYNSGYVPAAPALLHGDDGEGWSEGNAVKFNLASENGFTATGVSLSEFSSYINESMPAGDYTLTVIVPAVTENSIVYNAHNETYSFTVSPAAFKDSWREEVTEKFVNAEFRVQTDNDGQYLFNIYNEENTELGIWSEFESADFNPARKGVWARAEYDNYYDDGYVLTYNLSRMNNNRYLTYSEIRSAYGAPDTYVVYYQLEARNYESLTNVMNDSARRAYSFTVVIYDVITAPDASSLVYNRTQQIIPATSLYTVLTASGDDYMNAGAHSVTLVSVDPVHYRWTAESTEANYVYNYSIARDENHTVNRLTFTGWEYGSYDPEVNIPSWSTYYTDNVDNFYSFSLVNGDKVYLQSEFGNAPVGNYTLVAIALGFVDGKSETEHYNWNAYTVESEFSISITKATNEWYKTPSVSTWQYQGFNKNSNYIVAVAKFSGADNPVHFSVASDSEGKNILDGLGDFTTNANGEVTDEKVIAKLNALEAKTYYLISRVDEHPTNYTGLAPVPHPFTIQKAENSWTTPISVNTWITGKYDPAENTLVGEAAYGTAHFRVVDANDDTKVYYDDKAGIDDLANAPVGRYVLTVTIDEDANFYGKTDFITFSVFEKPGLPWWAVVLIVAGALGLAALVLYILHQKGILQLLSGKIIIAMRTKATVDATIAAIRANRVAEKAKISVAEAEAHDKAEAENKGENKPRKGKK